MSVTGSFSPFVSSGIGVATSAQSVNASGQVLSGDVVATLTPGPFEAALSASGPFDAGLAISMRQAMDGGASVFVRYRPESGIGPHDAGIVFSSGDAGTVLLLLSGVVDAGAGADAGADAGAGAGADAGADTGTRVADSGCSCDVGARGSTTHALGLLAVLLLVVFTRRYRRPSA